MKVTCNQCGEPLSRHTCRVIEVSIPEFAEARRARATTTLNPMERFVHEWEPAGPDDAKWRADLKAAIQWAIQQ